MTYLVIITSLNLITRLDIQIMEIGNILWIKPYNLWYGYNAVNSQHCV